MERVVAGSDGGEAAAITPRLLLKKIMTMRRPWPLAITQRGHFPEALACKTYVHHS